MANNPLPLSQKPALLLTRPRASAEAFVAGMDSVVVQGVEIVFSPLLEIVPTGECFDPLGVDGVIFTSAHAPPLVEGGDGMPAFCVGRRTAQAATDYGWDVRLIAETAEDLLSKMPLETGPLVHVAGQHRRGEIAEQLSLRGIPCRVHVAYDQRECTLSDAAQARLSQPGDVIVPLFSPRSADLFGRQAQTVANARIIAMSAAVAEAVSTIVPKRLMIAAAPTREEMWRCIENQLRQATSP